MPVAISKSCVFGVQEEKPLRGFPDGKIRIRMRNDDFAWAFVKTNNGIRKFVILDSGEFWEPIYEQGSNQRKELVTA